MMLMIIIVIIIIIIIAMGQAVVMCFSAAPFIDMD